MRSNMTKKLYKNINGKRIELTEKEIQEYLDRQEANKIVVTNKLKQEKIAEYQKYLADTDYVVVKISETIAENDEKLLLELKNKYSSVLQKRKEARNNIKELEKISTNFNQE